MFLVVCQDLAVVYNKSTGHRVKIILSDYASIAITPYEVT